MSKPLNTPILLIGFNRPDLMEKVLGQIAKVEPKRLYVAVDGSRNDKDNQKIEEIKLLLKKIDWKCQLKTNFAENNYGCRKGPLKAMNWFFENEEMGIIIEDDVLADESFFYYCQELLEKYKNDDKVGTISGNNFTSIVPKDSYLFSNYSQTWGWATWRRVWNKYDEFIKDWPVRKKDKWLENKFKNKLTAWYWTLIFNAVYSGEIESAWDYQWTYMSWVHNYLTIIPKVNLATNIGIGIEEATHTKLKSSLYQYPKKEIKLPLQHPAELLANDDFDKYIQKNNYVLWKEVGMSVFRKLFK